MYDTKWSDGHDLTQTFKCFFEDGLTYDVMLQPIKEIVPALPAICGKIIKFDCLTGLRSPVRPIINGDKEAFAIY